MSRPCLNEEELVRYHAEDLEPAQRDALAEHLAACAECAARDAALVARHSRLIDLMRGLSSSPGGSATPPVARSSSSTSPTLALLVPPDDDNIGADSETGVPRILKDIVPSLSGYEFLRLLGGDEHSFLYEAVQRSTKRRVAIRVLLKGANAEAPARRRFEREIELIAGLKHPGIVAVFDSGVTTDGRPYCVMDFVRGQRLPQYVAGKRLTLDEALHLFLAICAPVQYAHQRGIIHCDLRPANIVVEADGTPRILDFGLAKWAAEPAGDNVHADQLAARRPYLAPEQRCGNPDDVDTRIDVYALGVLLYELLAGRLPVTAPASSPGAESGHVLPPSRAWQSTTGVPPRPGRVRPPPRCPVDPDLDAIVLKTIAPDPAKRYQAVGELVRDVDCYLRGEPIDARRTSGLYCLRAALGRRTLPAVVVLVLLVLFCVAQLATFALWRRAATRLSQAAAEVRTALLSQEAAERQAKDMEHTHRQTLTALQAEREARVLATQQATAAAQSAELLREALGADRVAAADSTAGAPTAAGPTAAGPTAAASSAADPAAADAAATEPSGSPAAAGAAPGSYAARLAAVEARLRALPPESEAACRAALGRFYANAGEHGLARQQLARALDLRRLVLGDSHPDTQQSRRDLAAVQGDTGDAPPAERP